MQFFHLHLTRPRRVVACSFGMLTRKFSDRVKMAGWTAVKNVRVSHNCIIRYNTTAGGWSTTRRSDIIRTEDFSNMTHNEENFMPAYKNITSILNSTDSQFFNSNILTLRLLCWYLRTFVFRFPWRWRPGSETLWFCMLCVMFVVYVHLWVTVIVVHVVMR
jgi:hypothetical protein